MRTTALRACRSRTRRSVVASLTPMVEEGQEAPDFELTSDAGEQVRLSDLRGRPVVLYFYPKDDSP
jgi:cytochrome oxidase Cu insertion factor (SCO1/SenC/PrrC family)